MKFLNRLDVRLALLMALVVIATNLITLALTTYSGQRNFSELPRDVRDILQKGENRALPYNVSRELRSLLQSGSPLVIQQAEEGQVFSIYALEATPSLPQPIELRVEQFRPPGFRSREASFRARLEQSLWLATLASAIFGILMALVFSRRIARPLQAVSNTANLLAVGKLEARVPNLQGDDEVAVLGRNFNRMAQSLEQNEAERRNMIADIAHELRTPLTVMQGRLEAIQDGVTPLDMNEVDRLHRQTGYLARMVEDLRTLSLADGGKLALERIPRDLGLLIQEVASSFKVQASSKQIRLDLALPQQPLKLQADSFRLAQVVSNLISNAISYTPEGGVIRVEASKGEQSIWFTVSDTGPGIPEEALPKLFDRFYRAEASRSRQTGGSGLGLSIVKTLVELHGGKVEVRNRNGGGAEFKVSLPV
jgi:signal transduction histidine kinase